MLGSDTKRGQKLLSGRHCGKAFRVKTVNREDRHLDRVSTTKSPTHGATSASADVLS